MRKRSLIIVGGVVLLGLLVSTALFTVSRREYAIVTRFGALTQPPITEPGLYVKRGGFFDRVTRIDRRLAIFQTRPIELLLGDQHPIILTCYICWEVADPLVFYRSLMSVENANVKLSDMVQSSLGSVLSEYESGDIINKDPARVKLTTIESDTMTDFKARAKGYGIEVRDLGIRRIAYPPAVTQAVHNRMRSEREKEAKKYRGEGREEAAKIEAETDKQVAEILAEAYRQAETLRGRADSEATQIYAEAYSKDLEFFDFLRSLEAYKEILSQNATVVLSTKSKLFEHLTPKEPATSRPGAATSRRSSAADATKRK
ncbi:MAG: protease modulator HflC [Phycisphaerae bacterium]|nr:protease modulator HflC [Phycisphaerae bacterium]